MIKIRVDLTDHKDIPNNDEFSDMCKVIKQNPTGYMTIMFFESRTGDNNVWLTAPRELELWMDEKCPEEVFSDAVTRFEDDDFPNEPQYQVKDFYWNREDLELYVEPYHPDEKCKFELMKWIDWVNGKEVKAL